MLCKEQSCGFIAEFSLHLLLFMLNLTENESNFPSEVFRKPPQAQNKAARESVSFSILGNIDLIPYDEMDFAR